MMKAPSSASESPSVSPRRESGMSPNTNTFYSGGNKATTSVLSFSKAGSAIDDAQFSENDYENRNTLKAASAVSRR